MFNVSLTEFLTLYMPGLWIFVSLLLLHIILSTAVHIKNKDFCFEQWPKYMLNFTFFMIFIIFANAVIDLAQNKIQNDLINTVFIGIQAMVYVQALGYYINNILKHFNALGAPISPELTQVFKGITGQIKNSINR